MLTKVVVAILDPEKTKMGLEYRVPPEVNGSSILVNSVLTASAVVTSVLGLQHTSSGSVGSYVFSTYSYPLGQSTLSP